MMFGIDSMTTFNKAEAEEMKLKDDLSLILKDYIYIYIPHQTKVFESRA